ncbi:hypothetical protein GCM10022198_13970 [Klugiella xanthotipulae]|uniref:Uncharacterized protein n=1 Tax=Klugiella xanthotipulae TaxID=244735 RepID=A0A543I4H6_9MICO|nr:LapA family protein [Klugiella xanthotipulae]TQM65485.1 hypothetical protein FB466_0289 [Klugiella xanthotipulae]
MTHSTHTGTAGAGSGTSPLLTWLGRRWLGILIALAIIIVIVQNIGVVQAVPVTVFWMSFALPLWIVLAIFGAAGLITGLVLARNRARRRG